MKIRTGIDFSKHQLKITQLDGVLIHEFKKPDTRTHALVFINTQGVTTVTGDFGNWVFCREFHPSPKGEVSDGYWDEKLEILSVQKAKKYCSAHTLTLLKEFVKNFPEYYDREMDEEEKEWVEKLEDNVEEELEYTYTAFREKPSSIDYENVPFGKKRDFWLEVIYDGFEAICQYLKNIENEKV